MPSHYDDSTFSYIDYWQGRNYEHDCEVAALKSFLSGLSFNEAVDIGGGFGRHTALISSYSRHTTLIEPSVKQRVLAANNLGSLITKNKIIVSKGTAQKTGLSAASLDLAVIIRVMHHIPQPQAVFNELNRILKPGGTLILEFANSSNFKARLKSLLLGQPILPVPIEKRSLSNIRKNTIPFVNHNPQVFVKQLSAEGFVIRKMLSVSNFRSPLIKRLVPLKLLLFMEKLLQPLLASFYFGPSIFILAVKN